MAERRWSVRSDADTGDGGGCFVVVSASTWRLDAKNRQVWWLFLSSFEAHTGLIRRKPEILWEPVIFSVLSQALLNKTSRIIEVELRIPVSSLEMIFMQFMVAPFCI